MSIILKYLGIIHRGRGINILAPKSSRVEAAVLFWSTLASLTLVSGYVLCLAVLLPLIVLIAVPGIMLWLVEVQSRAMFKRMRLILALGILTAICFYA